LNDLFRRLLSLITLLFLLTYQGGAWLQAALHKLVHSVPGYNVTCAQFNTSHHGIPHNRLRAYVIGVRRDVGPMFAVPLPLDDDKTMLLSDLLQPLSSLDDPARLPKATWHTAISNVKLSRIRAAQTGALDKNFQPCPIATSKGIGLAAEVVTALWPSIAVGKACLSPRTGPAWAMPCCFLSAG